MMKSKSITGLLLSAVLGVLCANAADREKNIQIVYPSEAFYHNGGRVIDITQAPFNARNSGNPADATHNTDAFADAYDFVMDKLDQYWTSGQNISQGDRVDACYTIYIPEGTYYVNDTIIYSGALRTPPQGPGEKLIMMKFIGEKRDTTEIRLVDNCPGFTNTNNPKPLLSFGKNDFNNKNAKNTVRNLTINVGAGNFGATGIKMAGANSSSAHDLTIKTSDSSRRAFSGFDFTIGTVVGYYHDITVDGFSYGIRIDAPKFAHPVLEHITLKHQKTSAVIIDDVGSTTIRDAYIRRSLGGPGIHLKSPAAHAVVIDTTFIDGRDYAAIQVDGGVAFARNCNVSGFSSGMKKGSVILASGDISETVSEPVFRHPQSVSGSSLNLPIEDVPYPHYETDLNKIIVAGDDNPNTDDAPAIKAALQNSPNATTLSFPFKRYTINSTITIPSNIKRIDFMNCEISGSAHPRFRVNTSDSDAVVFQDLLADTRSYHKALVGHEAPRPVIMENTGGYWKNSTESGLKVFMNNCNFEYQYRIFDDQLAYVRFTNTENQNPEYLIRNNATVVVLGYKTEGGTNSFKILDSTCEILGGLSNQESGGWDGTNIALLANRSRVSFTMATSGGANYFERVVRCDPGYAIDLISHEDLPSRYDEKGVILPLYIYTDTFDLLTEPL